MHRFIVGLVVMLSVTSPQALRSQRLRADRVPPQDRAALEQRFRERLAAVVQKRLGLNDEQMRRLSEVNSQYEGKRRELIRRERETRVAVRRELMENATPNEELIAKLLQESARIQRDRLDLIDAEQADLARFLTPSQRARYLGLQEQMRRRIEEVRPQPPFLDEQGVSGRRQGAPGVPLRRRAPLHD
jgi:Spy/CpxP family protein refolding chaperone